MSFEKTNIFVDISTELTVTAGEEQMLHNEVKGVFGRMHPAFTQ